MQPHLAVQPGDLGAVIYRSNLVDAMLVSLVEARSNQEARNACCPGERKRRILRRFGMDVFEQLKLFTDIDRKIILPG